jgi:hypothetical protein
MSYQPPVDFAAHVGRETTLGDIFRAAWAMHLRRFWPFLGLLLLMALVIAAVYAAIIAPAVYLIIKWHERISWVEALVLVLCGAVVHLVIMGLGVWPMWNGYGWSAVRAFDGRRPQLGDLLRGFRACYWTLVLFGLTAGTAWFVAYAVGVAICPCVGPVIGLAAQLPFFIAPLFAFTETRPGVLLCLRYNWLNLRSRPGPTILICAIAPVASCIGVVAVSLGFVMITGVLVSVHEAWDLTVLAVMGAVIGLAVLAGALWLCIFYTFLKAALLRAAYSYSLEEVAPLSPVAAPLAATDFIVELRPAAPPADQADRGSPPFPP